MSAVAAAPTTTLRLRPLAPQIGVEIQGVDLSQPLDDEKFRAIEQAWFDHGIILFRDQQLSEDQQVDFARRFGELGKVDRKSSRLNSSHIPLSRMPSSA